MRNTNNSALVVLESSYPVGLCLGSGQNYEYLLALAEKKNYDYKRIHSELADTQTQAVFSVDECITQIREVLNLKRRKKKKIASKGDA